MIGKAISVLAITGATLGLSGVPPPAEATSNTVIRSAPPGGTTSKCLDPGMARLKAWYPLAPRSHTLAAYEAKLSSDATICSRGLLLTGPSMTTEASYPYCSGNCYRTFTVYTCDAALGTSSCYVNGVTCDWRESFSVRFEYHDREWVESSITENRTRFPGTWMSTDNVHIPLWSISNQFVGSVWDFARAYTQPGYVLARDEFTVKVGFWYFSDSWNVRLWMNLFPRGYVQYGQAGNPG